MNSTIVNMRKDNAIQVRVSTDLKEKLQTVADKEHTTISRLLLLAVAKQYPELNDTILKH